MPCLLLIMDCTKPYPIIIAATLSALSRVAQGQECLDEAAKALSGVTIRKGCIFQAIRAAAGYIDVHLAGQCTSVDFQWRYEGRCLH